MNVLFICDEYPPGKNGGIGTMVQLLARELVKNGHCAFVSGLYEFSYGQKDYEEDFGVKVWRLRFGLNFKEDSFLLKIYRRIPNWLKRNLNGQAAFKKYINFIEDLIEQKRIDIIEIPDWNTFAVNIGFMPIWPSFRVPLVVKSHGSYTYFQNELNEPIKPILNLIDKNLFSRADAVISVSQYTAIKNKELFGIEKEIKVLYNSVQIQEHVHCENRLKQTVIFTGSLVRKKGIFQLLKAWNIVNAKLPDSELIVLGKGKVKQLKKIIGNTALNSVKFMGHVNRDQLFERLSQATLAVFPSYSETFGLMCVEAMSVGCPVIYTKKSCGPEIVDDGLNGYLVDPDNVGEIADAIIKLICDSELQKNFSENGIETVRVKFNISESVFQHIEYYSDIISKFKKTLSDNAN